MKLAILFSTYTYTYMIYLFDSSVPKINNVIPVFKFQPKANKTYITQRSSP